MNLGRMLLDYTANQQVSIRINLFLRQGLYLRNLWPLLVRLTVAKNSSNSVRFTRLPRLIDDTVYYNNI